MDKLNSLGNPLEKLSRVVDFEIFRKKLEAGLYKEKFTNVGAKPYDYVLMFKILVLQRMYHLSDEQTEYQIRDRLSFRDFLLTSSLRTPEVIVKEFFNGFVAFHDHCPGEKLSVEWQTDLYGRHSLSHSQHLVYA